MKYVFVLCFIAGLVYLIKEFLDKDDLLLSLLYGSTIFIITQLYNIISLLFGNPYFLEMVLAGLILGIIITLTALVIYVVFVTATLALLVSLTRYMYGNFDKIRCR